MTPYHRLSVLFCLGLFLTAAPSMAAPETDAPAKANETIDISAEESLEWHQDSQLYIARGRAKAVRGTMTVEADILTAHQRDAKQPSPQNKDAQNKNTQNGSDIDRMTAEGNVHIYDTKQQVFGQKAVYDVDHNAIKITGDNLKLITEKNIVTAKDSLEYYQDKKLAIARGQAIGEHEGNRVEADLLTAQFAQNAQGALEMTELTAKDNVIIITKDGGVSRGNNALYNVKKNSAVLTDKVRITRGETQLAGDKALIDFTTGQSRLINSGSGRVRALLPASGAKKTKASP